MEINKIEMNGFTLYHIPSDKFKVFTIGAFFYFPFTTEGLAERSLLSSYLTKCNNNFQSKKDFSGYLTDIYGMTNYATFGKTGLSHCMNFIVRSINDKYLKDANINLFKEAVKVLNDTINNPYFNEDYFKQEKHLLLEDTYSLMDNKFQYATKQFLDIMYKDEKCKYPSYGSIEQIENMTFDSFKVVYNNLFNSKKVFFVIGDISKEDVIKEFEIFDYEPVTIDELNFLDTETKLIEQVEEKIEEKDHNQSIIIMGYRSEIRVKDEQYRGMFLFSLMMGGFFHSSLFQEIREKRSLSYSVNSDYNSKKGTFAIYAGLSANKIDEFKEVVTNIIEDYQNGNIDDEVFELTKKAIIANHYKLADRSSDGISLVVNDVMGIANSTIEERNEKINNITKEDVMNAAKCLKLDTIYILKGQS